MADTPTSTPTPPLLTDAELRAIAERAEAATPGPWDCFKPLHGYGIKSPTKPGSGNSYFSVAFPEKEADAIFIAAARSDVPRLLSENTRLRAYLRRLVACVEKAGLLPGAAGQDVLHLVEEVRAALGEKP